LKKLGVKQVFLVLFSSLVLLVLIIPISDAVDYTFLSLPNSHDLIPSETERVSTLYGEKHEVIVTEAPQIHERDMKPFGVTNLSSVAAHEKIIHSSDFDNDLKLFYHALINLSSQDTLVRVLHFGDSQIEGDRVSGKLRQSLQNVFGGCGTGFMPVSEHRVHRLNVLKYVSGWKKHKVFGSKPNGLHNKYGFLGYYHKMDSAKESSHIQLKKKRKYFKGVNRAETLTMLYRSESDYRDGEVLINNQRQPITGEQVQGFVHKRTWLLDDFLENSLQVTFKQDTSIDVYGLSLDCLKGVAVDNVGLRGSSGTEFTKINEVNLKNQLQLLNVKLVIYQFGVNVIPYVVNDYKFYENKVYRQLKLFKKLMPNAAILVVGVSDMCQKKDGEFISYPNIAKVILAQRKAASRADCAFWDLQKIMGGDGSMKNWVNAEPPLGEKDYTHFNRRGANLIGEKLFNALMSDFNSYRVLTP
jgi:lysophospholipase L1-like esterase